MSGQLTERLAPPEDRRPAQLGVILVDRVIIGHISATLIDLSGRGFLRIEEVPGGEGTQWLLTDLRGQAACPGVPLFPFERALLGGLFGRHAQAPSSHDHGNAGHRAGYDGYGGGSAISGGVNY